MKLVIRSVFFHTLCILIFALIYFYSKEGFAKINDTPNKSKTFIDFLLFSITVQAGVGVTDLIAVSYINKLALIIQQYVMLLTHVMTLYVFTL